MSNTIDHVGQTRPISQIQPSPWTVVPRLAGREYRALLISIRTYGILVPVIIDELGQIIDGYHRWRAANWLGRRDVPVTMVAGLTVMAIDQAMEEGGMVDCAPMWARYDAACSNAAPTSA